MTVDTPATDDRAHAWQLVALTGVSSIVIGVLVLAYPDVSVKLLGVFLGIDLLIGAIALIVTGAARLSPEGAGQSMLLLGILGLIAGVLVIRNPGQTVALIGVTFAIYLVVAGALALAHGLIHSERRGISLLKGLILVAGGTVILCLPSIGVASLALLVGIVLCLGGVVDLVEAMAVRNVARRTA